MTVLLASVAELEARLRVTFTGDQQLQAHDLLEQVSADIVEYCDAMAFTRTVDDVADLFGTWDRGLVLPGAPIEAVSAVTVAGDALDADDYDLVVRRLVRTAGWGGPDTPVRVTYTHGWDTGQWPTVFRRTCLDIAARAWPNPSGLQSVSIGSYSETYPRNGGGGHGLTAAEQHRLRNYRLSTHALA